jgi:hypothetical protein
MRFLLPLIASVKLSSVDLELPPRVTPIGELGSVERLRHTEVLQVERDFGRPNVNVALDAWMPADDAAEIDGVRLWWSDEVDRFPFSRDVREHLSIDYRRIKPAWWRISVVGDGQRFAFDVALHEGRPAAFADVMLPEGRLVRHCRAASAELRARRIFGIPVGLRSMVVTCTTPDGNVHRGSILTRAVRQRRPRR